MSVVSLTRCYSWSRGIYVQCEQHSLNRERGPLPSIKCVGQTVMGIPLLLSCIVGAVVCLFFVFVFFSFL